MEVSSNGARSILGAAAAVEKERETSGPLEWVGRETEEDRAEGATQRLVE
jgi:hypothetical protein